MSIERLHAGVRAELLDLLAKHAELQRAIDRAYAVLDGITRAQAEVDADKLRSDEATH